VPCEIPKRVEIKVVFKEGIAALFENYVAVNSANKPSRLIRFVATLGTIHSIPLLLQWSSFRRNATKVPGVLAFDESEV
jgi:hypothetical protein